MDMLATHTDQSKKINIMVVDDSAIVRALIVRELGRQPNFDVVASLANGEMAVNAMKHHDVDIVILDIEMPVMDGMEALPKLLAEAPDARVIMASTLTLRNADISLKALEMGAADYIPKPSVKDDKDALDKFYREMIAKVNALGHRTSTARPVPEPAPAQPITFPTAATSADQSAPVSPARNALPAVMPRALAIASSTGGPQALLDIFKKMPDSLNHVPIFITQHMPKAFTTILAGHLGHSIGRDCHEGEEGEVVKDGGIYLAPGDYHMVPRREGNDVIIRLNQEPEVNYCRPAADPMIDGLVDIYGKQLMLLVLTGMGHDGCQGARKLHDAGGTVIAQNKETAVVWGMPKAVVEHNLCRAVLPLSEIPTYLTQAFKGGST